MPIQKFTAIFHSQPLVFWECTVSEKMQLTDNVVAIGKRGSLLPAPQSALSKHLAALRASNLSFRLEMKSNKKDS